VGVRHNTFSEAAVVARMPERRVSAPVGKTGAEARDFGTDPENLSPRITVAIPQSLPCPIRRRRKKLAL
jgi:hypothetical protein